MSAFLSFLQTLNGFLWSGPMLLYLFFTHIYFTIRTKGIQKKIPRALSLSMKGNSSVSFATLATTLAATLGTGNIIGISTAIAFGGPGAVFWCWLTGLLGMATSYAECYLSLYFRKTKKDGTCYGGPMYLMKEQLGAPRTASLFAVLLLASSFCVGCSTQSQAATESLYHLFHLPPILSGILLALFVGLVLLRGANGVRAVCTFLVPVMGCLYLISCAILLIFHLEYIPDALRLILTSAFSPSSVGGGLIGSSFLLSARYGIARGLFTNEAGLGSAPVAAAESGQEAEPQALILMSATFWDTVVMCGITGLVIVSIGLAYPGIFSGNAAGDYVGTAFSLLPFGRQCLNLSIVLFAFATLLGWSFFGEKATEFLFGEEQIKNYRILYCFMIFAGSQMTLTLVWELSDLFNALMVIPNVMSLFLLRKYLPKR